MDNKTIKKLIQNYETAELQELILAIVSKNPSAQQALLKYCQKKEKTLKPEDYATVIINRLENHWTRASEIIDEFNEYGGGPEEEEEIACDELEKMMELLETEEIPWEPRKELLEEVLDFIRMDNSGFSDMLTDVVRSMCRTKEEKIYLADLLSQSKGYYGNWASEIYRACGEDKKYLESKKANLRYSWDYLELARYYEKHRDSKQALQIVQEGFQKLDGRLDEIYQYLFRYYVKHDDRKALEELYRDSAKKGMDQDTITELMHGYYKEKGEYENQKAALLKLLSCSNTAELYKLYQKCRQELTKEGFAKEEKGILKTIRERNLSAYFDILLDKNETKEVMDYIRHPGQYGGWGIDKGHYFTKRLSARYPKEIVELYWKETASYVNMGKEANYARAVSVLKEIRQIMRSNHWTDEWKARYQAFLEEHRRKKLLLKLLEGFKA